ncbi:MAG: thiazole synthase [Candidatus Margulisbacteria bacterium]|nr:thiazole synthase [Candidatus Margulisiibacteriota bacterium]MBU1022363.1 thiazole synthase [Candidatus Margulisiibacteriota bacterium]MBU1729085.1 thiazole synthase [Candidatus Margulisiibacteriota bacterium]MBU1954494.1 thiazole synthase [Candidatus Margulisiibacteriota bacterium]
MKDTLKIADREFNSRLFIGTGKFSSPAVMQAAVEAAESEIVTVALRRVDLDNPNDQILEHLDPNKVLILPNTSGARDHTEAVRLAKLAAASGLPKWIKLEVTPEPRFLLPDPVETLKAAEILVKDGFNVMPYINADPILAKRLEEVGCVTVMPLGSPIGSNQGIKTLENIKIILDLVNIPVVVDAGLGKPSDAALAMELGASAVLVNTAIATAGNPTEMAKAFKLAVIAGRCAYLSKIPETKDFAEASSPLSGLLR